LAASRRQAASIAKPDASSTTPKEPPGEPLAAAPATAKRQLTVMFCELVGSTALSGRLDPEDLRAVIGAYHRCVAAVIERAGAFVAKYMGDGVLAYFGYPRADEHDAECAVRAGLLLVEAVAGLDTAAEMRLQLRVGIATGLVVVGDLRLVRRRLWHDGTARSQGAGGGAGGMNAVQRPATSTIEESTII
jgi:class 3 adenylate cyclase